VITPLWEWSIPRNADGGSVGVSMSRHRAMQALARTLVGRGRPTTGYVVPVLLAEGVHGEPYYVRDKPQHTAVYDGQVLQWR
jgi:hypothetical protein